jgi:hypothetical protein
MVALSGRSLPQECASGEWPNHFIRKWPFNNKGIFRSISAQRLSTGKRQSSVAERRVVAQRRYP